MHLCKHPISGISPGVNNNLCVNHLSPPNLVVLRGPIASPRDPCQVPRLARFKFVWIRACTGGATSPFETRLRRSSGWRPLRGCVLAASALAGLSTARRAPWRWPSRCPAAPRWRPTGYWCAGRGKASDAFQVCLDSRLHRRRDLTLRDAAAPLPGMRLQRLCPHPL